MTTTRVLIQAEATDSVAVPLEGASAKLDAASWSVWAAEPELFLDRRA